MKKAISLILCIILMMSLSVIVYADFDPSLIKPDMDTIIVGVTGEDVPISGTLPHNNIDNGVVVIVPAGCCSPTNPITGSQVEKKERVEEVAEEEENNQSISINTDKDEATKVVDNALEDWIFKLVNEQRTENGLKALEYKEELQEGADIRARECATQFAHTRPNGENFNTVFDVNYVHLGENLIKSDVEIAGARLYVETWMNSPGHKANILDENYTHTAIGMYEDGDMIYVSQIFWSGE